jgi:hypothetical protein
MNSMNEIDELSHLRSEVPAGPAPARAHDALTAAITAERDGRPAGGPSFRRRVPGAGRLEQRRGRLALAGGLAVVMAAAGTAAGLAASGGAAPAATHHATAPTMAMKVAEEAAVVLRAQPDFPANQWVYFKEASNGFNPATGKPSGTDVGWETANGVKMATIHHGHLKIRNIVASNSKSLRQEGQGPLTKLNYASLAKLPAGGAQLDAYLASLYPGLSGDQLHARVAASIESLLTIYYTEPKITANLYEGLAAIPGVKVDPHGKDVANQPAIVLSYPKDPHAIGLLYLAPGTYQYHGYATYANDNGKPPLLGYAILRWAFVSGVGVTP